MKKILLILSFMLTSSLAEARDCTSNDKAAGHNLVTYSCFSYYHSQIIDYIDSRK